MIARRWMEVYERNYWNPDAGTTGAMRCVGEELEDRLEGIFKGDKA